MAGYTSRPILYNGIFCNAAGASSCTHDVFRFAIHTHRGGDRPTHLSLSLSASIARFLDTSQMQAASLLVLLLVRVAGAGELRV